MAKTAEKTLAPDHQLIERFSGNLDALIEPGERIGVAVSGGPDSLALLLLAAAARPGLVEGATVDHGLRPEARKEAEMVASLCERLGVPHSILAVEWKKKPESAIQERARNARYALLRSWAGEKNLAAILAGHHADDQAETLIMRLVRGAGVKGLAGMRRISKAPGGELALLRPLLGWRRAELEQLCADAGITAIEDPSNADEQFERVRIRRALADAEWFDSGAVALSATNLAQADAALHWATTQEWKRGVSNGGGQLHYRPGDAPREIRRRIVRRAVLRLATEGKGADLRGRELDKLLAVLSSGRKATLRGVLCSGGEHWRFAPAPARNA